MIIMIIIPHWQEDRLPENHFAFCICIISSYPHSCHQSVIGYLSVSVREKKQNKTTQNRCFVIFFFFQVSYFEIYMDKIRDLLDGVYMLRNWQAALHEDCRCCSMPHFHLPLVNLHDTCTIQPGVQQNEVQFYSDTNDTTLLLPWVSNYSYNSPHLACDNNVNMESSNWKDVCFL